MPKKAPGPPSAYELALDAYAAKLILDAIRRANGNRTEAREALGLTHRQLYREIDRLALWPRIDALQKEKGWEPPAGPPRRDD
jgi:DNA-binding NtrC family response regulator